MEANRSRAPTVPIRPGSSGPASDDQDSPLLQRMADGDESALAQLYDRWSQRVHSVAFWILRDSDDAEDVVEETFWQAWRTAGQFESCRASEATWLLMIARSRALDRLRARRRRAERTAEAAASTLLEEDAGRNYSVTPQPDVSDPSRELAEALEELPREQREALHLAYFAGLTHAEIAAQIAQPLGTVKTRIRLAMDKLRQKLAVLKEQL